MTRSAPAAVGDGNQRSGSDLATILDGPIGPFRQRHGDGHVAGHRAPQTSNRLICRRRSLLLGLLGGDSMTDLSQTDRDAPAPSIVPAELPNLSDDECLARLARAILVHDSA